MTTQTTTDAGAAGRGRGGRMSRQRKCDAFLSGGAASLATRPDGAEALGSEQLKVCLSEMLLERELLGAKIAALEGNRPSVPRRSKW